METKLITKTIKELADEYDGNVEQLHRTISRCNKSIIDLKVEIESLKYGIELERLARARAETNAEATALIMLALAALSFILIAKNILIG
jgi:hypothetical protein